MVNLFDDEDNIPITMTESWWPTQPPKPTPLFWLPIRILLVKYFAPPRVYSNEPRVTNDYILHRAAINHGRIRSGSFFLSRHRRKGRVYSVLSPSFERVICVNNRFYLFSFYVSFVLIISKYSKYIYLSLSNRRITMAGKHRR